MFPLPDHFSRCAFTMVVISDVSIAVAVTEIKTPIPSLEGAKWNERPFRPPSLSFFPLGRHDEDFGDFLLSINIDSFVTIP